MIFALMYDGTAIDYCIVADKPSSWSKPLRISDLPQTDSAVLLLSLEEGITVETDGSDGSRTITPIRPARLHLTPNLPERPGFAVSKIKVSSTAGGERLVQFDRDRGWENWTPNIRLY